MNFFDRILRLLKSGTGLVPAENCFFGDIELLEREGRLIFAAAGPGKNLGRFISWFRWLFLGVALVFAWVAHRDLGGAESAVVRAIGWLFILAAVTIGFVGAFVVAPFLGRTLRRLEKQAGDHDSKLPSFDVEKGLAMLPEGRAPVSFGEVQGFEQVKRSDGWSRLELSLRDGSAVFLFNFPTSRSEEISRMVERVKEGIGG